jgi:hypothetical protein
MGNNYTAVVRRFSLIIATCCLSFGTVANANAGLLGQDVFGVLNFDGAPLNLFDPANIGLSQGALNEISNPVTITDGVLEFSHVINGVNGVFANFTDNSLMITNDVIPPPFSAWTMSFQSSAFNGLLFSEVSDNFINGGVNATLIGDMITLDWAGPLSTGLFAAEFSLQARAVPLPATLILFGSGLAAMTFFGRRRKHKSQRA